MNNLTVSGIAPNINLNGYTTLNINNLIILVTSFSGSAHYGTFRKLDGTPYQVNNSLTTGLTIIGGKVLVTTTSAGAGTQLLYGDNNVGLDTTTVPTNPIYLGNDSGSVINVTSNTTAGPVDMPPLNFIIPLGKYPAAKCNGGQNTIFIYGFES